MCNDAIVHASADGIFVYLSPKCKMMLGYQPSELSEAALLGCVHPADLTTMRRTVTSHATKGGATAREPPPTMTVRIRAKDGLYVPLKLPMHPVMDGSKASSLIGALPRLQFAASPRRPRSNVSSAASSSNDLAAAADGAPPPAAAAAAAAANDAGGGGGEPAASAAAGGVPSRYTLRGPMGSRQSSSTNLSELLAEAFSSIAAADVSLGDGDGDGDGGGDGGGATGTAPDSPGEPLLRAVQLGGLGPFGLSSTSEDAGETTSGADGNDDDEGGGTGEAGAAEVKADDRERLEDEWRSLIDQFAAPPTEAAQRLWDEQGQIGDEGADGLTPTGGAAAARVPPPRRRGATG